MQTNKVMICWFIYKFQFKYKPHKNTTNLNHIQMASQETLKIKPEIRGKKIKLVSEFIKCFVMLIPKKLMEKFLNVRKINLI